ncbi:hypothetical protein OQX61_18880 [Pedobacter sp. PLR]|uniref:hypothetical protein n=1 Tax=Pedobacter sp. PLR TaxID=2994465 RepID=UPI002246ECE9|nr:hypothetical protein [Pedobacter sp. PLR]MCX2453344.1 hypothetical protein [Pedobacter sp. PLR]
MRNTEPDLALTGDPDQSEVNQMSTVTSLISNQKTKTGNQTRSTNQKHKPKL